MNDPRPYFSPKRLLQRLVPSRRQYDILPWGIRWRSSTLFIIFAIGMGMFSDYFLYSLIIPVIPFILRDRIGIAPDNLQDLSSVLVSVFAFASMLVCPIAGFLADKYSFSRQTPFLLGLIALIGSTFLFAVGQSIVILAVARFLQGASSGVVWTIGLALCLETVGHEHMGKTMGSIHAVLTAGAALGPVLGGVLYEKFGYIGVFGVAIAILIIDLILRLLVIEKKIARKYLDLYASSSSDYLQEEGSTNTTNEQTLLIPKAVDTTYEIKSPSKIIQAVPMLACLKNPALLIACLMGAVQALLLAVFDSTVPLIAIEWYDFSPLQAGLLFMPLCAMDLIMGPLAGWAVDSYGTKPAAVGGFGLLTVSHLLLRIAQPGDIHKAIIYGAILAVCGVGISIAGMPYIVEAGDVMEKYHKANLELFGENGSYAQVYGTTATLFSLGMTFGPLVAASLKEKFGYANMNTVLAGVSFLVMLLAAKYTGRPFPGWRNWSWSRTAESE